MTKKTIQRLEALITLIEENTEKLNRQTKKLKDAIEKLEEDKDNEQPTEKD